MANLDRAPCEGHKEQQDTPLEVQKATKSKRIPPLKAQKATKSQRITPLKARSGKRGAPNAKMEAEKLK